MLLPRASEYRRSDLKKNEESSKASGEQIERAKLWRRILNLCCQREVLTNVVITTSIWFVIGLFILALFQILEVWDDDLSE
jgi:hypothetical protein